MKTYMPSASSVERKWYVVDASQYTLGRLTSQVASVLRGKNKPEYTPNLDLGDYVIVINAEKVKLTGKKLDQKIYYNHSEYVGGMKETTLAEMMDKKPEKVIELAVKGMLPKGPLGRQMYTKLHVYVGPEHKQAAGKLRTIMSMYRENKDLIDVGMYQPGSNPKLDTAIEMMPKVNAFLQQRTSDSVTMEGTIGQLVEMMEGVDI